MATRRFPFVMRNPLCAKYRTGFEYVRSCICGDGGGKSVLMMTARVSVCERYYAEEAICAVEAENGVEKGRTRDRCAHREPTKTPSD